MSSQTTWISLALGFRNLITTVNRLIMQNSHMSVNQMNNDWLIIFLNINTVRNLILSNIAIRDFWYDLDFVANFACNCLTMYWVTVAINISNCSMTINAANRNDDWLTVITDCDLFWYLIFCSIARWDFGFEFHIFSN